MDLPAVFFVLSAVLLEPQLPMQKKHKVGCYFCDFVLSEISWKKLVIFCVLGFQDFLGTVADGPERAAR